MGGKYGPFFKCPDCYRKTAYEWQRISGGGYVYYCKRKHCFWHDGSYLPPERYFGATAEERMAHSIG